MSITDHKSFRSHPPTVKLYRRRYIVETQEMQLDILFNRRDRDPTHLIVSGSDAANPKELYKTLLGHGALFTGEIATSICQIQNALDAKPIKPTIDVVLCNGWVENSYVQPDWLASSEGKAVISADRGRRPPSRKGDADDWREGLTPVCAASSYATFAIGLPFAATLLRWFGEDESVIFNYFGKSTGGKTLSGRLCQSVFDRCDVSDLLPYDATPRAAEERCLLRNDLVVVIDEQGRAGDGKKARDAIKHFAFMITSGRGRPRAAMLTNLPNLHWSVIGYTSGEESLEKLIGSARSSGEQVRHIELPIPKTSSGIFDRLGKTERYKAASLAQAAEEAIGGNHGVALRRFIRYLQGDLEASREAAQGIISAFEARHCSEPSGWERRFARKFGLVAAGMILAARAGVAPWDEALARRVARRLYQRARAHLQSVEERAASYLISLSRDVAQGDRYPRLSKGDGVLTRDRKRMKGFVWQHPSHGQVVAVDPAYFERRVGPTHAAVLGCLVELGAVVQTGPKRRLQIEVSGIDGGARKRWIAFRMEALGL